MWKLPGVLMPRLKSGTHLLVQPFDQSKLQNQLKSGAEKTDPTLWWEELLMIICGNSQQENLNSIQIWAVRIDSLYGPQKP